MNIVNINPKISLFSENNDERFQVKKIKKKLMPLRKIKLL